MTKNDYFAIAKAIKETFKEDEFVSKRKLLCELIPLLKQENPSFQSFRFLVSCDATELHDKGEISL